MNDELYRFQSELTQIEEELIELDTLIVFRLYRNNRRYDDRRIECLNDMKKTCIKQKRKILAKMK